ncbi:hypothetical protein YM304_25110 [Ilumatobacter coccineus YM16-304]|uniref:Uncharacterized protein n=2 Tax=Ilumatobacter coccineus TaxID=467094 RepID=A0A6C7ECH1_ILUCY|nr:hypothetical protein YM304_25110 [Ilumatobacter coccineus YM16-304]
MPGMYGVPQDLDLSAVAGEFTTQVRVGQYDLQFTFGSVNFAVQSQVSVLDGERVVARWSEGVWPEAGFFDVMNAAVVGWTIGPDRIDLDLENGLSLRFVDDSEQYETMQIRIGDDLWVI